MNKTLLAVIIALAPIAVRAQQPAAPSSSQIAPGTMIQVEMLRDIDAKKAHSDDSFQTRLWEDVTSNGKIILPKKTVIVAHVVEARPRGKDNAESKLTVAFDKALLKDHTELPLHGVVARVQLTPMAVAAGRKKDTQLYSPNAGSTTNIAMPAQLPEAGTGGPDDQLPAPGPTNVRDLNIGVQPDASGTATTLTSSKDDVKLKRYATLDVRIAQ